MTIIRSTSELGASIYTRRKRRGWNQSDLAREASVRQQLISDLENGRRIPRLDTIVKVLAALDLDLSIVRRQPPLFDPLDYRGGP